MAFDMHLSTAFRARFPIATQMPLSLRGARDGCIGLARMAFNSGQAVNYLTRGSNVKRTWKSSSGAERVHRGNLPYFQSKLGRSAAIDPRSAGHDFAARLH